MALPFSNTVDRTLERLRNAFVETARGAREVVGAPLRPDLPDDDIPRLKSRIDACLEGKGGETARRARAAELGQAYLSLSPAGRKKFLLTLAHDYGLPREAAMAVVERWRTSKEPPRALVRALEPPAVRLLREFVGVPQGVKFVVDLRAELLALGKSDAAARMLSEDLRPLLGAWFDVGFLDLVRIDWRAPAALLEKLVTYEAVHTIRSWRDLKNRLDSDRRCFAFFHPRMPDEPLIFVEVALVDGHGGQRAAPARRARRDGRSRAGQHGDLLFDLQLPAGPGRHQLRQLPDQAGGRAARARPAQHQGLRHPLADSRPAPACRRAAEERRRRRR